MSTRQIVEISHLESAWIENQGKNELLSYQTLALKLKTMNQESER